MRRKRTKTPAELAAEKLRRTEAGHRTSRQSRNWEGGIDDTNKRYRSQGRALVSKVVTPKGVGKGGVAYMGRSPADFVGHFLLHGLAIPVRFDAKTFEDHWSLSEWKVGAKKRHQFEDLLTCWKLGGLAFALVRCEKLAGIDDPQPYHTGPLNMGAPPLFRDCGKLGMVTWLVPIPTVDVLMQQGVVTLKPAHLDQYGYRCNGSAWLECVEQHATDLGLQATEKEV